MSNSVPQCSLEMPAVEESWRVEDDELLVGRLTPADSTELIGRYMQGAFSSQKSADFPKGKSNEQ
jgi:hypothetical protein